MALFKLGVIAIALGLVEAVDYPRVTEPCLGAEMCYEGFETCEIKKKS